MKTLFLLLMLSCAALAEDGKVFIKSDPAGAMVSLIIDNEGKPREFKELGKTGTLIQAPKGEQRFLLSLADYSPEIIKVTVADGIVKPDVVKLEKPKVSIDVVFDEGWAVYIDKQPVKDKQGKPAVTPCTISLTIGTTEIGIAKEGFNDIVQKVEAAAKVSSVELKGKPVKGTSKLLNTIATQAKDVKAQASDVDYDALTPEYWKGLPGEPIKIDSTIKAVDTKIDLLEGQKVFVIPNPEEKWQTSPNTDPVDYKGYGGAPNGLPWMLLCFKIGANGKPQKYGVAEGPGRLYIFANDLVYSDNKGSVHVKIIPAK